MNVKHFSCCDCENEWTVPYGTCRPAECPKCYSNNIHRSASDRGGAKRGRFGFGRGRCRRSVS